MWSMEPTNASYFLMEQHTLKNVKKCFNTNIYSFLETSGGQSSNLHLNLTSVLIRHLWQLKTVVFVHWFVIHAVLLDVLPMDALACNGAFGLNIC
jgi:hypothetical protein